MHVRRMAEFTGQSRPSGTQINFQRCPVCGSDAWKVYVDPTTGKWFCFAGQHNAGGVVEVDFPGTGAGAAILAMLEPQSSEPLWRELQLPGWTPLCPRATRYLERRGVGPDTVRRLGIVEMAERMRVLFPYRDDRGQVIWWNARSYTTLEEGPKYLGAPGKHPLYVLPNWHPSRDVVLVEGVFDAIAVWQHVPGVTAVALGGKFLPKYLMPGLLRLAHDAGHLTVMLDNDALAHAISLQMRLRSVRPTRVALLPAGEDPASMGPRLREVWDELQDR